MKNFHCIHCGSPAKELYRDFKSGIIKISHCVQCSEVVDKYIEYEPVIVLLDVLLLKSSAYKHILLNSDFKSSWKLLIVLLLSDTFTKLAAQRSARSPSSGRLEPDYVFYSALEWDLYWNYLVALAELSVFLAVVLFLWILWMRKRRQPADLYQCQMVVKALVISDFGKLLLIPVMLWGQTYSVFYLWICHIFVFASNIQAVRVVSYENRLVIPTVLVCLGYTAQWFLLSWLPYLWISYTSFVLPVT